MKLIRSIAMTTDYTFHGSPCEVSRVDLYLDESVISPEVLDLAQQFQEERLLSLRKRVLHSDARKPTPTWERKKP